MKTITRYAWQLCLILISTLFASCADEILLNEPDNLTGQRFELTTTQSAPTTRLELGQDGLTTQWQPNDKLVLVKKDRFAAPIYLTCTLTEPASSATFVSESGVPAGEYWVLYNYNENLAYGHQGFSSIEEINDQNKLVLYAELNITANTSQANVEMQHLYAQVKVELKNLPNNVGMGNMTVGMYSSKKGMPVYKLFTANGLVNAEYGYDPNNLDNWNNAQTYFKSDKKYHNIRFGEYQIGGSYVDGYNDPDDGHWVDGYFQPSAQQLSNSALVLPEDLSQEDVYFYVLSYDQCFEFKKANKVNLQAGISYKVVLDFNDATVKTSTLQQVSSSTSMTSIYKISSPVDWRHAAYRAMSSSNNGWSGNYKIVGNIDFTGDVFFPIVASTIDGNGMKLSNITLEWAGEDNVGLYKTEWEWNSTWNEVTQTNGAYCMLSLQPKLRHCTISDLTLENVTFKGKSYVGAFGGYNVAANKCKVIGTSVISGAGDYVGGIVGWNRICIDNMSSWSYLSDVSMGQDCTVTGVNYVGGIVGAYEQVERYGLGQYTSSQKPLDSCVSSAAVTATGNYVGGIFGKMGGSGANNTSSNIEFSMDDYTYTLLKCQNKGNVTGNDYVGGIGGDFALNFSGGNNTVDRVVLRQSCSDGKVKGNNYVGGVLGSSGASVNTCYSINTIEATTTAVGGIVGMMNVGYMSRIANCYSLSDLKVGTSGVAGGILSSGGMGATVTNSYFAGTNPTNCGIIGNSAGSCTVDHCLTTLSSLGTNLDVNGVIISYDPSTGLPNSWSRFPDIITDSTPGVTSILANKSVINRDNAYSDNIWSVYQYECVKFASFSADTNSPDFGSDTIN